MTTPNNCALSPLAFVCLLLAFPATAWELTGAITGCHDPSSIARVDGVHHIWSTAENLNHRTSIDLVNWTWSNKPFSFRDGAPESIASWCRDGHDAPPWNLWAPEIVRSGGRWLLFVSRNCPRLDSERSLLAVSSSNHPNGPWTEPELVLSVDLMAAGYRVIDPALARGPDGRLWLTVGSFGSPNAHGWTEGGIRLFELDTISGRLRRPGDVGVRLAGSWIEAPWIEHHNGWWYLYFNEGRCCEGLASTYAIKVGRSRDVAGPYLDREGRRLLDQGGTLMMGADLAANWRDSAGRPARTADHGRSGREHAPGHVGVWIDSTGREILTFHFYDSSTARGEPTLGIRTLLRGTDGWPRPGWAPPEGMAAALVSRSGNRILSSTPEGAVADSWRGGREQLWTVHRAGRNRVRLAGTHGFLGVRAGRPAISSAQVDSTSWEPVQQGDGSFVLRNSATRQELSLHPDAGNLSLASPGGGGVDVARRFHLVPSGPHEIRDGRSGQWLTALGSQAVIGGSPSVVELVPQGGLGVAVRFSDGTFLSPPPSGTPVGEAAVISPATPPNAHWIVEPLPDGSWRLLDERGGRALGAEGPIGGSLVRMRPWLGVRSQQWSLVPRLDRASGTAQSPLRPHPAPSIVVRRSPDGWILSGLSKDRRTILLDTRGRILASEFSSPEGVLMLDASIRGVFLLHEIGNPKTAEIVVLP